MTQTEKILDKGVVTEEFLNEEVRCDFFVSAKRKRVWAIELDLLTEFDRICKKHGLKYFMGGGSLLGAVRHKGFIPWDDDIDVNMMRPDYERFLCLAGSDLKEPYFLQTPHTDPESGFSFAKLRNSSTSCVSEVFRFAGFNQGIGIDIFPYDNVDVKTAEDKYNAINRLNVENSLNMRRMNPFLSDRDKERMKGLRASNPCDIYDEVQRLAVGNDDCDFVGNAVYTAFNWKKNYYKKELFADFSDCKFECLTVPIPVGWEECLKIHYGNWRELPPKERRGTWHDGEILDPDAPYTAYLRTAVNDE